MKIVVTGASGLVGSELVPFLTSAGHDVYKLVRKNPTNESEIFWNPEQGMLDPEKLQGVDAVIHLAGENIAEGRWSDEKKTRIRESRVQGTQLISETLAKLTHPPKVFISASAIGFYGNRGEEVLTEESAAGSGFLPEVCEAWEKATQPAKDKGIRVVNLRIGIILSGKGGALGKMLPPFLAGAGGILGNGKQYMSWIALDDVIGIIYHALNQESLSGPVNTVAPRSVQNREFTTLLGKVLHRPTIAPVPAFAVNMLFGEMGEALLLSSSRVEPLKLQESGYQFRFPDLEDALRHVLGKS